MLSFRFVFIKYSINYIDLVLFYFIIFFYFLSLLANKPLSVIVQSISSCPCIDILWKKKKKNFHLPLFAISMPLLKLLVLWGVIYNIFSKWTDCINVSNVAASYGHPWTCFFIFPSTCCGSQPSRFIHLIALQISKYQCDSSADRLFWFLSP